MSKAFFGSAPPRADGRTRGTRWQRGLWAAVPVAILVLASCSDDKSAVKSPITDPGISLVTHTADEIDLIDNATQTVNGAVWSQSAAFQVGTGNLNPFLRFQDSPNEEAFNTSATNILDNVDSWTDSLPLNHVPVITVGTTEYREFILDANESNSAPDGFFSIDQFNLWLCDDPDAPHFTTRAQFESNTNCHSVYNLGGKVILATDYLSSGSGNGYDYRILIPETLFETAAGAVGVSTLDECAYNGPDSAPCGAYLILDTKMGNKTGSCAEASGSEDCWHTGASPEEISTLSRPWVTVTKTATPSFKQRKTWSIDKSVSPASITQFIGQSTNATWTITATQTGTVSFDALVSGTITVANTSGAAVSIISLTDVIPGYPTITPACTLDGNPFSFPGSIPNNKSLSCTYSVTPPDTEAGVHTNTATAVIEASLNDDDPTQPASFKDEANFNFATATASEVVDNNPNIYDNAEGGASAATTTLKGTASQASIQYTLPYECGASRTVINVARLDLAPTGSATGDPTDAATLTINCLDLTVTKTAATTDTRTYKWLIDKTASPSSWNLFNGDQGTTKYTVTATPNGFDASSFGVSGNITIHNPNSVPVILSAVKDTIIVGSLAGTLSPCTVGGSPVTVAGYSLAGGADMICPYSATLPDATTRTNTAIVLAKPTSTGTEKRFTGTASVDPSTATHTEVNKTVNVYDKYQTDAQVLLGSAEWNATPTPTVFYPTHTFTCDADAGSHTNVARIDLAPVDNAATTGDPTDGATVTVTCRALTVTKTAPTKWRRSWSWSVEKSSPDETSATPDVTLDIGQTYNIGYDVLFTSTKLTDDNFRIEGGTITVTNPAGSGVTANAVLNSVADVVSGIADAPAVTCTPNTFPQTLSPGSSLSCTYATVSLPNNSTRTNTASTKRQARSFAFDLDPSDIASTEVTYSSTATDNVTFSSTPTEAVDECVNVADTYGTSPVTGKICAGADANAKHFTYNRPVVYTVCGPYTVENTASFTSTAGTTGSSSNTATPLTGNDGVTVSVDVRCPPQGCTLTQGYWKTHNASFKGGAPADDAWGNIGSLKELMGFFTDGTPASATLTGPNPDSFTWFSVFWTAPKGDAYYNLAHQWMAAVLNVKNGASPSTAVADAISGAETYFSLNGPKGKKNEDKTQLITWAGILGNFNEGKAGVDHCSEDFLSSREP